MALAFERCVFRRLQGEITHTQRSQVWRRGQAGFGGRAQWDSHCLFCIDTAVILVSLCNANSHDRKFNELSDEEVYKEWSEYQFRSTFLTNVQAICNLNMRDFMTNYDKKKNLNYDLLGHCYDKKSKLWLSQNYDKKVNMIHLILNVQAICNFNSYF